MGTAAGGALHPHEKLGLGRSPGEEQDVSSLLQSSSVPPVGLVLVLCWVHWETLG